MSQRNQRPSGSAPAASAARTYLRQPDSATRSGAAMLQQGGDWKRALDTLMAKNPAYNARALLDPENP